MALLLEFISTWNTFSIPVIWCSFFQEVCLLNPVSGLSFFRPLGVWNVELLFWYQSVHGPSCFVLYVC